MGWILVEEGEWEEAVAGLEEGGGRRARRGWLWSRGREKRVSGDCGAGFQERFCVEVVVQCGSGGGCGFQRSGE